MKFIIQMWQVHAFKLQLKTPPALNILNDSVVWTNSTWSVINEVSNSIVFEQPPHTKHFNM